MNIQDIKNQVIVVYDGSEDEWDETSIGLGGSETWVIGVTTEWAKLQYDVYVVCHCKTHIAQSGVMYVCADEAKDMFKGKTIDHLIMNRIHFGYNEMAGFHPRKIYLMVHDSNKGACWFLNHNYSICEYDYMVFVSNFQKNRIYGRHYMGDIDMSKCVVIPNGVDESLYKDKVHKKNKMVWSSDIKRNVYEAITLFDILRDRIPDFEMDICHPSYNNGEIQQNIIDFIDTHEGIRLVGAVDKPMLAKLQLESKIWFYKSWFNETFCISCMENIFADNVPIVTRNDGMNEYLKGFPLFFDKANEEEIDVYKLADIVYDVLVYEQYREMLLNRLAWCKDYYTWKNVANMWCKLFNS